MNKEINKLSNGDFEIAVESSLEWMPTTIGGMSMIGVMGDAPHHRGNYFWLQAGPRIVNFWAENLEAAEEKFNLRGKVRVRVYEEDQLSYGLIEDDRIPEEWYAKKLCFTGTYRPSLDIIKDMYNRIGDPDNNIEEYSDPVTYYKKLGHDYDPATGRITYYVNDISR